MREGYPPYDVVGRMLVLLIWRHGGDIASLDCRDTYAPLADLFRLTFEQRNRSIGNRNELLWPNHVQFGRRTMCNAGYIHFTRDATRRIWTLTASGQAFGAILARSHPDAVAKFRNYSFTRAHGEIQLRRKVLRPR